MPSTASHTSATPARSLLLLSLLTLGNVVDAVPPNGESRSHYVVKRAMTYSGCYSSSQPLSNQGPYTWQSTSYCSGICGKLNSAVLGLSDGKNCWCGNQLPSADSKVDDSNCNVGCDGYGSVMCGGSNYWSVYLTGTTENVQNFGGGSSSSSSSGSGSGSGSSSSSSSSSSTSDSSPTSTTTKPPTVVTSITPGKTVVVTEPAAGAPSPTATVTKSHGGSSNVAGIAAGVVVGVVGFASIIGVGTYFFLRQRKRKQAEEEYRQRSQADFMRGIERKGSISNSYSNMSDSRMDPEAGRRNSVGSLADNQDYSRRILRVANPDSS